MDERASVDEGTRLRQGISTAMSNLRGRRVVPSPSEGRSILQTVLRYPCSHCGGYARVSDASGVVVCARCRQPQAPLPYPTNHAGTSPHFTFLRVGMSTDFSQKTYYAVARFGYSENDLGEFDNWEEWLLLTADGDIAYLEYDEGVWTFSEPFEPSSAPPVEVLAHAAKQSTVEIDGIPGTVVDCGNCWIAAVEGEAPWPVQVPSSYHFVDMLNGGLFRGAEIDRHGHVEWVRGRRMTDAEVRSMFRHVEPSIDAVPSFSDASQSSAETARPIGAMVAILFAVIAFALSFVDFGHPVGQTTVQLASVPPAGFRAGPFMLTQPNRVCRVTLSTSVLSQPDWVQGIVENGQTNQLTSPNGSVSADSGYTQAGASVYKTADFRVDTPGAYYVRILAPANVSPQDSVTVEMEDGVLYKPYLWIFSVVAMIAGIGLFVRNSRMSVWQAMSSP